VAPKAIYSIPFVALEEMCQPKRPVAFTDNVLDTYPVPASPSILSFVSRRASVTEPASCPICCADLGSNREEVGALTYQGRRIEPELYHLGCITMMLSHQGSIRTDCASGDDESNRQGGTLGICWGLSPVTRKPIDNFMPVPPLDDRRRWVEFVDWRRDGRLNVEELSTALAAALFADVRSIDLLIRSNFVVDNGGFISETEFEHRAFPYVKVHFERLSRSRANLEKKRRMVQAQSVRNRLGEIRTLARASKRGNQETVEAVCLQLDDTSPQVRRAALRALARIGDAMDKQTAKLVSARLEDRDLSVRRTAERVLSFLLDRRRKVQAEARRQMENSVDEARRQLARSSERRRPLCRGPC